MTLTYQLDNIRDAARTCLQQIGDSKVIAFHGEMGAGKTTFIHAVCDELKVSETVSSPTFSLINEYHYPGGVLYHIDLYRLEREEDAFRAGVEDCLFSGNLCLVEWPERAPSMFPEDTIHLKLEVTAPQTRKLTIDNG